MWLAEISSGRALLNVTYLLARYGHIVAAMLLIGGLLFHEMVVPLALLDEREESRLAIFARARWSFRRIAWGCVVLLLLSGIVISHQRVPVYMEQEYGSSMQHAGMGLRTGWWWVAHICTGSMAMIIALYVIAGNRPVAHPISWLRLDLVLMLVVVFLGSMMHYVDRVHLERTAAQRWPTMRPYVMPAEPAMPPTYQQVPVVP